MVDVSAARVGLLSRSPAGITAVRRARDELALDIEFVLLEENRAVVIAALNKLTLQPRPLSLSERSLLRDPDRPSATGEDSCAVRVMSLGDDVLALAVPFAVPGDQLDVLVSLSHEVSAALSASTSLDAPSNYPDRSAILENQRDVVFVLDSDFMIRYCNHAVITMFGWLPSELIGRCATEIIDPADLNQTIGAISRLQAAKEIYRVRLRLRNASGTTTPVSVTAIDQSQNPAINGLVVSVRPADYDTENTRTLRDLEDRARLDQLTGLVNRRTVRDSMLARSSQWAAHANAEAGSVSVCFIGIDDFKVVNDIHGHQTGDELLQAAASRLRAFTNDTDLLARIGGDEFVLVLVDGERSRSAPLVAQHLRAALSEPYEVGDNRLHLTASVGIATRSPIDLEVDALLQDADIALAAAKERGRDQIVEFDADLARGVVDAQSKRTMVRDALDNNRLIMHYQPIVNSEGQIVGFEALARCLDQNDQLHMPADFLPAITKSPLIDRLDRQAFEQSCRLAASLQEQWPEAELFVACNFSANTIAQSDYVETVLATMLRTGATPASVSIEITESDAFEASPRSISGLTQLHDAGVHIALDDFGTGYSSLSHLRDLPLTSVKIDRTFIQKLHTPGPEQTITRAITELARSLGFTVIAEGTETSEQISAAHTIGIDRMQGWFFDKALTIDQLQERLADQDQRSTLLSVPASSV